MTGRELIKLLERNGWKIEHVRGSHYILRKGGKHVSIPVHGTPELGKGLLHRLMKEGGLK